MTKLIEVFYRFEDEADAIYPEGFYWWKGKSSGPFGPLDFSEEDPNGPFKKMINAVDDITAHGYSLDDIFYKTEDNDGNPLVKDFAQECVSGN